MRARALVSLIATLVVTACSGQGAADAPTSAPASAASPVAISSATAPAASAAPSRAPSAVPSALEGVWQSGVVTPDDATATLQAAGLGQYAQAALDFLKLGNENVYTLRVLGGRWALYWSKDGGLSTEQDAGTYRISANSVTIRHGNEGSDTHEWLVVGDTLTITYVSDTINAEPFPNGEEVLQRVLYMSSPWTRSKS